MLLTTNIILYIIQQKISRLIHIVIIFYACMLACYSTKHMIKVPIVTVYLLKSRYLSEGTHPGVLTFLT